MDPGAYNLQWKMDLLSGSGKWPFSPNAPMSNIRVVYAACIMNANIVKTTRIMAVILYLSILILGVNITCIINWYRVLF